MFEALDRPAMRALPASPYVFAEWKEVTVAFDYHVEIDGHYYSVPHALVGHSAWARFSAASVEVFFRSERVSSHVRSYQRGVHTTIGEHMPKSHRAHAEWSPQRLIQWGVSIGVNTGAVVEHLLRSKPHPEQGYRACLGLLSLSREYGDERLEAASALAVRLRSPTRKSVKSILESGRDRPHAQSEPLDLELPIARQRPRSRLLPLTMTINLKEKTMLTNPTIETLKSLKLHGMIQALEEQQQTPTIQALVVRGAHRAHRRSRAALSRQSTRITAAARCTLKGRRGVHRGYQLQSRPRPRQTADRHARHRRMDPPIPEPAHHRRDRLRQDLARLRSRTAVLSPRRFGNLLAGPATDRGAARRPRRRQLHQVPEIDRQSLAACPR